MLSSIKIDWRGLLEDFGWLGLMLLLAGGIVLYIYALVTWAIPVAITTGLCLLVLLGLLLWTEAR